MSHQRHWQNRLKTVKRPVKRHALIRCWEKIWLFIPCHSKKHKWQLGGSRETSSQWIVVLHHRCDSWLRNWTRWSRNITAYRLHRWPLYMHRRRVMLWLWNWHAIGPPPRSSQTNTRSWWWVLRNWLAERRVHLWRVWVAGIGNSSMLSLRRRTCVLCWRSERRRSCRQHWIESRPHRWPTIGCISVSADYRWLWRRVSVILWDRVRPWRIDAVVDVDGYW